jgi:hypothetical protein
MKNVVECPREFIAYFNALETTCEAILDNAPWLYWICQVIILV